MTSDGTAASGNAGTRRPLRRDAEQNRLRIIRAAQEIFAANGLGAGLNDIAHHAGVGVGTVYRRFPDKAALVHEALHHDVELLLEVADEALTTEPAWNGLMLLIEHVADLLVANLGLRDIALGPGQLSSEFDEIAERIRHYLEELLRLAQEEGSARQGVTPQDFTMMYFMITEFAMHATEAHTGAYRRYLAIFTDGLRASRFDAPLPDAVSATDAEAVARRWTSGPH